MALGRFTALDLAGRGLLKAFFAAPLWVFILGIKYIRPLRAPGEVRHLFASNWRLAKPKCKDGTRMENPSCCTTSIG